MADIIAPRVFLAEDELVIEWPGKLIISVEPSDPNGCGVAIRRGDEFVPITANVTMDELRAAVTDPPPTVGGMEE